MKCTIKEKIVKNKQDKVYKGHGKQIGGFFDHHDFVLKKVLDHLRSLGDYRIARDYANWIRQEYVRKKIRPLTDMQEQERLQGEFIAFCGRIEFEFYENKVDPDSPKYYEPKRIMEYCRCLKPEEQIEYLREKNKTIKQMRLHNSDNKFAGVFEPLKKYPKLEDLLELELKGIENKLAELKSGQKGANNKMRSGVEGKSFIYLDEIQIKLEYFFINKPCLFRKALNYKKHPKQFQRDLHTNLKFVKYPILEIRNKQTGKSTGKLSIKRNSDQFSDNNILIKKIENIIQKNTKKSDNSVT